ncbi:hypothetical protein SADUNF_Sadunf11G0001800 [Salix dunnii]|uniref:Homeodomain-like superfamily protein n=1 Tax=Salix dunnii TaxID=1413687 RepID=A0A835MNJ1_9ROSI|nr:hypothetical protein SADUNF_Sadunf11G0001800 [Salix dunnii]
MAAIDVEGSVLKANENEEDDEEEDMDFNPFLKGTPSPEASSSLSSELEGLEEGVKEVRSGEVRNYDVGDVNHGEEVVVASGVEVRSVKEGESGGDRRGKRRKLGFGSNVEDGNEGEKESGVSEVGLDVDDDEDAICKRTRARYSLASFTLDELEMFLQESDDEDDLPNVDDEVEYRKFLAAVLLGGDGDGQANEDNENVEDDDEDNDADFEIELEELLDSDVDNGARDEGQRVEYGRGGRRPETRQKKRQKTSAQYKKKLLEQSKRPLLPLLPVLPNGFAPPFHAVNEKALAPKPALSYASSAEDSGIINGFTPQQINQLHCLIHEHIQLLIQVFSLCILDSSRQHLASQVQGLIFEMLHKRDNVIACKRVPYPGNCFRPPYMCSSVADELLNIRPAQCIYESPPVPNLQMSASQTISLPQRRDEHACNQQMSSSQIAGSSWSPYINGPIVSILDVAPLNLVGRYMDDVYNAVREHRQRFLNSSSETWNEKEPLFYLPHSLLLGEANEVLTGNVPLAANRVTSSTGQQATKKTLAASIVESTKKQSVALVPKDISKLAQRFFPLFNPVLFPHKPPPAAVANRVLFTDSEDELLALGIMEYNTDWKAIQQRFLPCKSKHQIFVRQKNRCSSKAPENPIKAVRRMKTSPLTAEETERIQEGLRVYKLDWLSVWKFVVPHRDPSLLPRQLRIALGTQKSYKQDAAKKEKRRISEAKKRSRTTELANWKQTSDKEDNQAERTGGGNSSGDDCVDNVNEAYVHQAFLSDWRPVASGLISSDTISREDQNTREHPNNCRPGEAQLWINNMNGLSYGSSSYQYPFTHAKPSPNTRLPNYQISNMSVSISKPQIHLRPYRSRKTDGVRLVRLAPDLPPVNLPRSVRIISQSAFERNQCGSSIKVSTLGSRACDAGKNNIAAQLPNVGNLRIPSSVDSRRDKTNQAADHVTDSHPEESAVVHNACIAEERGTDSDLQIHPLLFQAPEGACLPYFPLSCYSGSSSSFSFFSGNQPQLNLSLFHNPLQANHVDGFNKSLKSKDSTSASCSIDFHPLLQRTDGDNNNLVMPCSNSNQFVCSSGESAQFQNHFGVVQNKSFVNHTPIAVDPKHSSSNEKANDLDLDIHLSSNSAKEISERSRDVGANNQPRSTVSEAKSGRRMETCKINSTHEQHNGHCPMVHSNLVSGADASPVQSNNASTCNMDDVGDQSHPEIVMEQEELSDSDEEIEENVEFECEEMADSDGEEGAGCEPVAEVEDKDAHSFAMEEVTNAEDYGDQQCKLRSPVYSHGKPSILRKGSPLLNLSLTSLGKETTSSSWLSLDSRAPVDSPRMKTLHEKGVINDSPTAKNLASCRPNRLCKKTPPSTKGETQKDVSDMAHQLSLGPLAVSTLRKPRKRTRRTNTKLGTRTVAESGGTNTKLATGTATENGGQDKHG